jgi:3-dehydroquinate dehydratase/shikimate dehydrogenase
LWKAGVQTLADAVKNTGHGLGQRSILVLGNGGTAAAMAYGLTQFQGLVSVCGPNDKEAQGTATKLGCRFIPFQNLYDTLFDVAVIADPALKVGAAHGNVNAALLRDHMMVLDVSDPPRVHELATEARLRGCHVIDSAQLFHDRLAEQYRAIVGKDLPEEALAKAVAAAVSS